MARNYVEYRLTGGQNTKDPADSIEDGQLQLARNCRVDEAGCVASNPGEYYMDIGVPVGTAAGDYQDNVFGMFEGYVSGSRYIYAKSQQKWVRYPYTTTRASFNGLETELGTFPASSYPLSGLVYNGVAYFADGYTLRRTTGTTMQRVGCAIPTPATTATETQAGASVTGHNVKFYVTFYNGVAESNFSEPKAHTFSASSKKLKLVIPVDAQSNTSTTKRRLYRTDNNGVYGFYVTEVQDNTTTSVIDPMGILHSDDSEAASGDEVKSERKKKNRNTYHEGFFGDRYGARHYRQHQRMKDKFAQAAKNKGDVIQTNLGILADWDDHDQPDTGAAGTLRNLVLSGDVVYGIIDNNTLAFSDVGNPEHWSPYNRVPIGRLTGETLLCIKEMEGDIICYTDLAIWRFRRLGQDATNSTLEQVTTAVGTVSAQSVCALSDGTHLFMAKDGIYQYDGRSVQKISNEVDNLWTDSTLTSYYVDPSKVASVACIAKDKKAWFSYRLSSGTTTNAAQIHVNMEFGSPRITVDTFNGYACYLLGSDGTVWGGRGTRIVIVEGANDGEVGVTWTVKTKQFPITSALQGKRPVAIVLDAALRGAETTVTVYGDNETTIATYTLTGYDGRSKIRRLLPFKGAYNRVSVQVESLDFDVRRLYAIGFEAEESDVTE